MDVDTKEEKKEDKPQKTSQQSSINKWKQLHNKISSSETTKKKSTKLNVINPNSKKKKPKNNKKKQKENSRNSQSITINELNELNALIDDNSNTNSLKLTNIDNNDNNNNDNDNNDDSKTDKLLNKNLNDKKSYRAIRVPGHRMIHIRRLWKSIVHPIVSKLKLQIRMNSNKNVIELRTSKYTTISNAIQKGTDFINACIIGFEIKDSIALIRLDNIYLEKFDIRDVKMFKKKSDHWMRAVGRIAGQYGKIKYSIENSTNSRIIIFAFNVYILGSFDSIRLARSAISRLIMGSAPGNVYAKLRTVSDKLKHNF